MTMQSNLFETMQASFFFLIFLRCFHIFRFCLLLRRSLRWRCLSLTRMLPFSAGPPGCRRACPSGGGGVLRPCFLPENTVEWARFDSVKASFSPVTNKPGYLMHRHTFWFLLVVHPSVVENVSCLRPPRAVGSSFLSKPLAPAPKTARSVTSCFLSFSQMLISFFFLLFIVYHGYPTVVPWKSCDTVYSKNPLKKNSLQIKSAGLRQGKFIVHVAHCPSISLLY